jgi:hypothetical protein
LLGLRHALGVSHFFNRCKLAPHVCAKSTLNPHAPTAKAASRDAITKNDIPAGLVAVAFTTFSVSFEAVDLAVHNHLIWWLDPYVPHLYFDLIFWCCWFYFPRLNKSAAKYAS